MSINRIRPFPSFILVYVVFLVGCTNAIPVPTETPSAMSSLTLAPPLTQTTSTAPTSPSHYQITNVDSEYPDSIFRIDAAFSKIQSGIYMIGYDGERYTYSSLDGAYSGTLAEVGDIPNFYAGDFYFFGDASWTTTLEDPEYMIIGARQEVIELSVEEGLNSTEMLIRAVKIVTGVQHTWTATFHPEMGMVCTEMSLSPTHEWMALDCWMEGERYLFFLNIQEGTATSPRTTEYHCLSEQPGNTGWVNYSWSPDGQWLSATCEHANDTYMSCLVSPATGEFYCPRADDLLALLAWSPDGSKVVIEDGGNLLITDWTCLKDTQLCPEYLQATLPSEPYYSISAAWDGSGEVVVWSSYVYGLDYIGYSNICVANLENNQTNCIDGPKGTEILSISPDGKWFAITIDENGLMTSALLSSTGEILRRIQGFIGWLLIP